MRAPKRGKIDKKVKGLDADGIDIANEAGLIQANFSKTPPPKEQPMTIMVKLGETGQTKVQTLPPPILPAEATITAQGAPNASNGGSPPNNLARLAFVCETAEMSALPPLFDLKRYDEEGGVFDAYI